LPGVVIFGAGGFDHHHVPSLNFGEPAPLLAIEVEMHGGLCASYQTRLPRVFLMQPQCVLHLAILLRANSLDLAGIALHLQALVHVQLIRRGMIVV
jgi:hypothetical protein